MQSEGERGGRRAEEGLEAAIHYCLTAKAAKTAKDYVRSALRPLRCSITKIEFQQP